VKKQSKSKPTRKHPQAAENAKSYKNNNNFDMRNSKERKIQFAQSVKGTSFSMRLNVSVNACLDFI